MIGFPSPITRSADVHSTLPLNDTMYSSETYPAVISFVAESLSGIQSPDSSIVTSRSPMVSTGGCSMQITSRPGQWVDSVTMIKPQMNHKQQ
mmetsp:Transcript_50767/g.80863  ORF Transcript_50767/g.80863 Transcript_50767/m.80863 type:complete len:92 (+) Transcript_50767:62-337(+)